MKAPKSALTTWPHAWELHVGDYDEVYALNRGLDPQAEFEKFKDYHLAHGSLFANWFAAWRTWCRNAQKYAREKNPQPVSNSRGKYLRELDAAQMAEAALTPEQRAANAKYFKEALAKLVRKW